MQKYTPRKILITGGSGFIGANFIRHLLATESEIKIINLDLLTYAGSQENLEDLPHKQNYRFVQGNICDAELISQILSECTIDTIVHFAAESHVDRSITAPEDFIKTNVLGTFTLLQAAREYWLSENKWNEANCRFHHISTDEVFGSLGSQDPAFNEKTPYAPNSPYSASKAGSDHLVRAYHHTYGLPVTITNCSNNYGPYQHSEKFIPTIIRSCLKREAIPVYGNGSNIRDWLHVEDHCHGITTVLKHGHIGEFYNIGGNNEWKNLDLVKLICRLMDEQDPEFQPHSELIHFVTDRPGHDWRYAIDSSKMRNILGWVPKTDFIEGLRQTIQFYANDPIAKF